MNNKINKKECSKIYIVKPQRSKEECKPHGYAWTPSLHQRPWRDKIYYASSIKRMQWSSCSAWLWKITAVVIMPSICQDYARRISQKATTFLEIKPLKCIKATKKFCLIIITAGLQGYMSGKHGLNVCHCLSAWVIYKAKQHSWGFKWNGVWKSWQVLKTVISYQPLV